MNTETKTSVMGSVVVTLIAGILTGTVIAPALGPAALSFGTMALGAAIALGASFTRNS
jgi:hypothetical protein